MNGHFEITQEALDDFKSINCIFLTVDPNLPEQGVFIQEDSYVHIKLHGNGQKLYDAVKVNPIEWKKAFEPVHAGELVGIDYNPRTDSLSVIAVGHETSHSYTFWVNSDVI